MKPLKSVSILIPAYNDASTIERAVTEAYKIAQNTADRFEIIVINDNSRDNTASILSHMSRKIMNLKVQTHQKNYGYGETIKELYYAGMNDWLFTIPGDYQIGAKELLKLIPLKVNSDMIIGWRTNRLDTLRRKQQSKIYNLLLQFFFRMPVHDANSIRLMKRDIMKRIRLNSSSAFVDAELILCAQKAGFRVTEAEITHRKRTNGTQGGGGKLRTIIPTIIDMFKHYFAQQ